MTDDAPQMPMLPWFPRDFASSTRFWPLICRGIYRELIDVSWDIGGLPNDEKKLRKLVDATPSQWKKAWELIEPKFPISQDGKRRNRRLEQHRVKALNLALKRKEKAKDAANKRWGNFE